MDLASLLVYGAVFGFTIGAYVGLTSVILVDLLGLDKLTNAFGLLLLFQGIATFVGEFSLLPININGENGLIIIMFYLSLGPPIVGFLYDKTNSYTPGFVFAGVMIAFSGLILFCIPPIQTYLRKRQCTTDIAESAAAS